MYRIVVASAFILALVILFVPTRILWLTESGADGSPPQDLLTWNTKNSTRLAASTPTDLSIMTSRTLFPQGSDVTPGGVVLAPANNWQASIAAAPLIHWVNGPLLLSDGSTAIMQEVGRLHPASIHGLTNVSVVQVGIVPSSGIAQSMAVPAADPATLAADVDTLVMKIAGQPSPNVLIVPDDAGDAVPAAYYAAQTGDAVLFGGNPLPAATRQALAQRAGHAHIYVLGPGMEDMSRYGTVQRVSTRDAANAAVALAQYYDQNTRFGWGLDASRYDSDHNFVLANPA